MRTFRVVLVSVLAFTMGFGMCACQSSNATKQADQAGVAAVVNGVDIPESKVTAYIDSFRSTSDSLSSDSGWESYLESYGFDEQTYRTDVVIQTLIKNEVVRQAATAAGIEVDESVVDEQMALQKGHYDSDAAWEQALAASGYTEEQYRQQIEYSYIVKEFKAQVIEQPTATQEQIQEYCNEHALDYACKRSSYIQFSLDDKDQAQTVLEQLQKSDDLATDFAAAAAKYSTDENTAAKGGDVGWSALLSNANGPYMIALDDLAVGELSDVVQTSYGYDIIYCTDEFDPTVNDDGNVKISTIPTDIYGLLMDGLDSDLLSQAFDDYVTKLVDDADITIYDLDGNVVFSQTAGSQTAGSTSQSSASVNAGSAASQTSATAAQKSAAEAIASTSLVALDSTSTSTLPQVPVPTVSTSASSATAASASAA